MRTLIAVLVTVLLTAAGCGGTTTGAGVERPSSNKGSTSSGAQADLDFTTTTLDGKTFEGMRLEGKPAVLWFWAPWCSTCRAQRGTVSRLADQYAGQVSIVAVGGLDDEAAIREQAEKIPNVIHLVDDEGAVWKHFGVTAQSTYEVVSADGRVVSTGFLDNEELTAAVAKLAG